MKANFLRSAVSFDNLKKSARHAIKYFLKFNERYFAYASKIAFLSWKIAEPVDLFNKYLQQSVQIDFLNDQGLESTLGVQEVLFFFKQ